MMLKNSSERGQPCLISDLSRKSSSFSPLGMMLAVGFLQIVFIKLRKFLSIPSLLRVFFKNKFIYLFLAALGLCCCAWAFSSCDEWGLLFIAMHGLLIAVASLVAEHGLQARGLSSCGTQAQLLYGMWDLPGPGLEPISPSLAGRFLITGPPGKPTKHLLIVLNLLFLCKRKPVFSN